MAAHRVTDFSPASKYSFDQNAPTDALGLYKVGGDSFVSSITLGSQYFCAYTFTAESEESYEALQANAQANFSGFATEFSASFEASISSLIKTSNVTWSFQQSACGWAGKFPDPSNQQQFVDFVLGFPAQQFPHPDILDFSTQSFTAIPNCPKGFDQIMDYSMAYLSPIPDVLAYADTMLVCSLKWLHNEAQVFDADA